MNWFKGYFKNKNKDTTCSKCGSTDVETEVKIGRGLPPKDWSGKGKISWKGTWDITTCKCCGNVDKHLRR